MDFYELDNSLDFFLFAYLFTPSNLNNEKVSLGDIFESKVIQTCFHLDYLKIV